MLVNIEIDDDIAQELNQVTKKPINQLAKDLLLEALEDARDAALGDAAMEELEQEKDSLISLEDWLAQDD